MAESAGVGAEEGFDMLLDSEQIRSIPVLGSMIEERSRKTVPRARRCAARAPNIVQYHHSLASHPTHISLSTAIRVSVPFCGVPAPHRHE